MSTISSQAENLLKLATCTGIIRQLLEQHLSLDQDQTIHDPLLTSDPLATADKPIALVHLCHTFNLTPFEQAVLLLCIALELDPQIAQLCADFHGNDQQAFPTPRLAQTLFLNSDWQAFSAGAPLRHWHLVELKTEHLFTLSSLRVDPAILLYLLSDTYHDSHLTDLFEPAPAELALSLLSPSHQVIAQQIAQTLLSTGADSPDPPAVQLYGGDDSARAAIALAACALMGGMKFSRVSLKRLTMILGRSLAPDAFTTLMQRWVRMARLTNQLLLVDCDSEGAENAAAMATLSQLLDQRHLVLILTSPDKQPSQGRSLLSFEVPPLTVAEQTNLWELCLGAPSDPQDSQIPQIVSQFNLSANAIQTIAAQSLTQPSHPNTLWNLCRQHARPRLDDLAQRIDTHATWDDLILPDLEATQIKTLVAHIRQRFTVYQSWGFATKSQRGLGISALFQGKSGTGKTTAAEIIAKALHLDLYRIDLSQVVSKYIGETEKNLRSVFDAAEAGGVVLLFDEADALFGKRSDVKDSHDRYANMEVSYLLQKMEAYQGLAILTTNLRETIDSAFVRRIRFIVKFSLPDYAQRKAIWERMFPVQMPQQEIHLGRLARLNVTGGSIKNIALNAAFLAAEAGEAVQMKHCLVATRSEYKKLEQLVTEAEIEGWV
jgi:hypothetical protein